LDKAQEVRDFFPGERGEQMARSGKTSSIAALQVRLAAIRAASADLRAEAITLCQLADDAIRWTRDGEPYRQYIASQMKLSAGIKKGLARSKT
jgi:hypothetical protein